MKNIYDKMECETRLALSIGFFHDSFNEIQTRKRCSSSDIRIKLMTLISMIRLLHDYIGMDFSLAKMSKPVSPKLYKRKLFDN